MSKYNFDKVAAEYDEFYKTEFGKQIDIVEKRLIKEFIDKTENKKALEIGCGTGHWTKFFVENGFQTTGIDISEKMIEKAREKDIPMATFIKYNAENMPFADESFENIFTITTLEFVENLEKALNEIYRILKPKGYFIIGCLNANSELAKSRKNSELFSRAHFFSPAELETILEKFGHDYTIKGCALVENNKVSDFEKEVEPSILIEKGAFLGGMVKKSTKNPL